MQHTGNFIELKQANYSFLKSSLDFQVSNLSLQPRYLLYTRLYINIQAINLIELNISL